MEKSYQKLLSNNKAWANEKTRVEPDFFDKLSKGQTPEYLWIGCSDSRVPANEITGTNPGEIFVHRNIANMVIHSDMNMLSVLSYAVEVLKVKHIIVCGHYGCGGVIAAMGNKQFGLIDNWLRHIKDVYRLHQSELDAITDTEERGRKLVELNVI
jgi:carbonic anhydrase